MSHHKIPVGLQYAASEPKTGGTGTFFNSPVKYARYKLSGADNDNNLIALNSSSAHYTTIHTCTSIALDEVFLWCGNYSAADSTLFLGIGSTDSGSVIQVDIPKGSGLIQVYPGISHQNTVLYAWAGDWEALNIGGYTLRYYLNNPADDEFGFDGTE